MNKIFIRKPLTKLPFLKRIILASSLVISAFLPTQAQLIKVGTGTGSNATTAYPTPFGNSQYGQRAQYMYRATELAAAGLKPGWIDSLAFKVTGTTGTYLHSGFRLSIGSATGAIGSGSVAAPPAAAGSMPAAATSGAAGWQTGLNLVYYDPIIAYMPFVGMNSFKLSIPFYWNGYDNIVVGTCFWSGIKTANAQVEWTTGLSFNGSKTFYSSVPTHVSFICDSLIAGVGAATQTSRPNIYFNNKSDTCNTTVVAGKAIAILSAPPTFCLHDDSLVLSLEGATLTNGLSFQWQRSSSATGPWSNYGAASTTKMSKNGHQTESTYYRCIVTCVAKGISDISTVVYVPQAPPYNCDCASNSSDNTKEDILMVNFESIANSSPCSASGGLYEDYTLGSKALPPAEVEPGTEYSITMRLGACDNVARSRAVKVFIDYNQDGQYDIINPDGVKEMVYANTYTSSQPVPQTALGSFTIPTTAKNGLTTMRIVYGQATVLGDIKPCGAYVAGETHDYPIKVLNFGKPTVTGRLTVCEHDSVVMNVTSVADTPVVFSWTGPGGFTGVGPKIVFVDADPSLSGYYYVTATSGGRTSSPQKVLVTVNPKPPIPTVLNANMCQYESSGKLITDGKNVIWYTVPVGGYGDTNAPIVPTHTPNSATYYLTQTVNGCVSDRGKVDIKVIIKPAPPVVVSPVTYCQLQDPDLVATGKGLKWYLDSAAGVPSTISPIPPTGWPDTVSYYVSQTINGCESDRARVKVIVYQQPNGIVLHTKPFVCQYDTASFIYFGNAPTTYEYKWMSEDGIFQGGGGQGPVVYRFNEDGDKIVSLYVNNGKCATFKINDTITVRSAPIVKIDNVQSTCVDIPTVVAIDTVTPYADNYTWNWGTANIISETQNGGPYNISYSTPGIKKISLMVYHRTCPSLTYEKELMVWDRPKAKILSYSKITNYGKDTSTVNGKICSRDTIVFNAYYDSSYTYKWRPDFYFDIDTNHIASDRMRNPAYIAVDVYSSHGCYAADSVYINAESCCEMEMPNAFTPNNDYKNDWFRPIRNGKQDIVTFRIFNRWGQLVYETANSDAQGWDGSFAGRPAEMGVYQYYIKYRCLDGVYYEKRGDLTLIR